MIFISSERAYAIYY